MALEQVVAEEAVGHSTVLIELNRLLENQRFSASPQMSAFLQYVVLQTLEGNGNRIKAYTIGVDALGKPDAFDAQNDPSVRVLALRLRKALAMTYESGEPCEAIIELKPGSYVPEFRLPDTESSNIVPISTESAVPASGAEQFRESEAPRLKTANGTDLPYELSSAAVENVSGALASNSDRNVALVSRRGANALKSTLAMLVVSAVMYSFVVKAPGNTSAGGQEQLTTMVEDQLPLRLMSMTTAEPTGQANLQVLQKTPSVLLSTNDDQSERVRQMSLLISASLVEAGAFDVVRTNSISMASEFADDSYALIFNEMSVDSRPRIDMQLVRMDTGSIIMNETLVLDKHKTDFSTVEVTRIEKLAHAILDPAGPLSVDFCKQYASDILEDCA